MYTIFQETSSIYIRIITQEEQKRPTGWSLFDMKLSPHIIQHDFIRETLHFVHHCIFKQRESRYNASS